MNPFDTLGLSIGMMILVALMRRTGLFEYIGFLTSALKHAESSE